MRDRPFILQVTRNLMREGFCVMIPARFNGLTKICNESDLEMLRRADAVYLLQNWTESNAAGDDLQWACHYKKKIFVEGMVEPA